MALVAWVTTAAAPARAQTTTVENDPTRFVGPRLVDRATAPLHGGYAIAGISHRKDPMFDAELGLGPLAAVGFGYDDRLVIGPTASQAEVKTLQLMRFRIGVEAHRWSRAQPALDLAFERSIRNDGARAAELHVTATERWSFGSSGALEATAGIGLWEIASNNERLSQQPWTARIRPFLGVAWTPPAYPRTALLLEGSFGPAVIADQPRLDWRLGWGARYRAFSWSSIDLVVRNRQSAGLAGSTVMVRLSAEIK
jgi:hypothetical protein